MFIPERVLREVDEMKKRMVEVYEGYSVDERFVHLLPEEMITDPVINALQSVDTRMVY